MLPFLLRSQLRPGHPTDKLHQIGLPFFPREDSLAEALELPPLAMEHSFYMPVSAIRGLFSQLLRVPIYRQPNTLGWPYLYSAVPPAAPPSAETFLPLHHLLKLLPNFMPTSVQGLLSSFRISGTNFYELAAFGHLQSKGILPGSRSDAMDAPYDWPLEWDLRTPPGDACFAPLQHSHPDSWQLLISLGGHFLKRLIAALLSPNGHFPSFWCLSPPSFVYQPCSPPNLTSRLLLPQKPSATSWEMLLTKPNPPMHECWPTVFPSSFLLTFSHWPSKALPEHLPPSCASSSLTIQCSATCVATIQKSAPSSKPVD